MTAQELIKAMVRCRLRVATGVGILAVGILGGTLVWADEGDSIGTRAIPNAGVKTLRPAATGPSLEDNIQRQSPPPPRPGDLRPPTPTEMEQHCLQNPRCKLKLNQARQGLRPSAPLPAAAAPSQEEQLQRQLLPFPPVQGKPLMGPRSQTPGLMEQLFSWLNPFAPRLAWAQTPVSFTLTPDNRYAASGNTGIGLFGGYTIGPTPWFWMYNAYSTNQSLTENKPAVYLYTTLPTAGYYLIDIVASPSLTKFRHSSGQILETWDDRAGCGGTGVGSISSCHHVTVDYYTAGNHFWYFWADPTVLYTYFFSVTLKSYP